MTEVKRMLDTQSWKTVTSSDGNAPTPMPLFNDDGTVPADTFGAPSTTRMVSVTVTNTAKAAQPDATMPLSPSMAALRRQPLAVPIESAARPPALSVLGGSTELGALCCALIHAASANAKDTACVLLDLLNRTLARQQSTLVERAVMLAKARAVYEAVCCDDDDAALLEVIGSQDVPLEKASAANALSVLLSVSWLTTVTFWWCVYYSRQIVFPGAIAATALHALFVQVQAEQQAVWRSMCKASKASLVLRRVRRIGTTDTGAALLFLKIVNNKKIDAEAVAWNLGPQVHGVTDVATAIRDEVWSCMSRQATFWRRSRCKSPSCGASRCLINFVLAIHVTAPCCRSRRDAFTL